MVGGGGDVGFLVFFFKGWEMLDLFIPVPAVPWAPVSQDVSAPSLFSSLNRPKGD